MARAAAMVCTLSLSGAALAAQSTPLRVADVIGLTLLGSDAHNAPGQDAHVLSPDGQQVAVVVQTGNLTRNTVDYALLVFSTEDHGALPPDTVVALASSSNEPAISHVRWLSDNRTLAFLGGRLGEVPQVYTVDIATRTLTPRTHSATGVMSFETALSGDLIYQDRAAVDTSDYATMRAHGFVVSPGLLPSDVIAGDWRAVRRGAQAAPGHRIVRGSKDEPLRLPPGDSTSEYRTCALDPWYGPPLNPVGGAVMLICTPRTAPAIWREYRNPRYRLFADRFGDPGKQLVLMDLTSGHARTVYDAPVLLQGETNFVWAPDGRSVVVSTALLPLTGPDSARRAMTRVAAEVDLETGAITIVVPRDSLVVRGWDVRTGIVEFVRAPAWFEANDASPRVYYRNTPRGWQEAGRPPGSALLVTQDLNTPPRLVAVDPKTRAQRVIFDPNPGLARAHRFGHVETVYWTTKAGHEFAGGLYYPPDYVSGRHYSLVIQTHGYDSTVYAPDGLTTTGTAAQPLAGAGIVVLQVATEVKGNGSAVIDTPAEGPFDQDMLEGAIDALDQRGVIERARVGLHGFSRTCFTVLYFLTHSTYAIAAADLSDGVDYSYLQYLVFDGGSSDERINGGRPWGATQAQWLERAPGFRLDRVTAALRLTAIGPHSVLQEWEPYAGLSLQGKPAELVYIPDGSHVLVKPWERITSQQGALEWYRFWLQGYEDPNPAKSAQYTRWRRLRAQRDSSPTSISR